MNLVRQNIWKYNPSGLTDTVIVADSELKEVHRFKFSGLGSTISINLKRHADIQTR